MIELRFDELEQMTSGCLMNDTHSALTFRGVSIDSRTINPGELFVAIRGESFDGHDFIAKARVRGAGGTLRGHVSENEKTVLTDFPTVVVSDSHEAMIELARKHRESMSARWVAITGSNGKTTTKELAYHLIKAAEDETWRSPGNYNNLFGIPLSIFSVPTETKVAVLELGISRLGEMERLAKIVMPDAIVITNIGSVHLEFLGSIEKVAQEKLQLVRNSSHHVPVIYNGDDKVLREELLKLRPDAISFGLTSESNFFPDKINVKADGTSEITILGNKFSIPLFGKHQVYNFLAAYALFVTLGYKTDEINSKSINFTSMPMRGEIIKHNNVTFIADCYNANPDSVISGLESFVELKNSGRKIAIIGDMLELGDNEKSYHQEIGKKLAKLNIDMAFLVGTSCSAMADAMLSAGAPKDKLSYYEKSEQLAAEVSSLLNDGDIVYVKGSRGVHLEKVIEAFREKEERA